LLLARQDVHSARRSLHRRVGEVCRELIDRLQMLLSPLFLWDTYKFCLASLCFGVLVPVHLIGTLLSLLPRICASQPAANRRARPTACHFWMGGALWAGLVAFPFALVYQIAPTLLIPHNDTATNTNVTTNATSGTINASSSSPQNSSSYVLGEDAYLLPVATGSYLGVILLLGVLSSCVSLRTDSLVHMQHPKRTLRFTAPNALAIFQVLLDVAQLVALPFLALHAAGELERYLHTGLLRSTGIFHTLRHLADAVLLWQQMTTPLLVWFVCASLGLICLWYLLFSLPIVIDELLKWTSRHGKVADSRLWQALLHPLNSTLHLTVVMQLIKPLGCTYKVGKPSTMHADPSLPCYDPEDRSQPIMALCSLLGLAFYLLTVHILVSDDSLLKRAQEDSLLDVRYPELYQLVGNAVRASCAVCYLMLRDQPLVLLPALLCCSVLLAVWSLGFRWFFKAPACCITGVLELRVIGEAVAAWGAVCCLVEVLQAGGALGEARDEPRAPTVRIQGLDVYLAELLCLSGWLLIAVLGLLASTCRQLLAWRARTAELGGLRECARLALELEAHWHKQGGVMSTMWTWRRAAWRRAARRVADVPGLSRVLVQLEQNVKAGMQTTGFIRGRRAAWQAALTGHSARSRPTVGELHALVHELTSSVLAVAQAIDERGKAIANGATFVPLLHRWAEPARKAMGRRGQDSHLVGNAPSLTYTCMYKQLLLLAEHAGGFEAQPVLMGVVHSGDTTTPPLLADVSSVPQSLDEELVPVGVCIARTETTTAARTETITTVAGNALSASPPAASSTTTPELAARGGSARALEQLARLPQGVARPADTAFAPAAAAAAQVAVAEAAAAAISHQQISALVAPLAPVPLAPGPGGQTTSLPPQAAPTSTRAWALRDAQLEVSQLVEELEVMMTNFERIERVREFASAEGSTVRLTCAELEQISLLFTLSIRRKAALIALHPRLSDPEEFSALLEQQLEHAFDREDVRREVTHAERRAWLENAFDD